uniref:Hypothetical conserved protein n=1 Tax=uncultured Chloroflexota bacterium TaxID=166587 RepID=H5SPE6_9CHLR|nr:hypothetical conserved protein [uncultured Chloroflexota bacterium]
MASQQVVPVTCANCNSRFNVRVQTIVDGQDPVQKSAFLQGRINLIQCPQCGLVSPVNVPILYYDLQKELAFVFAPNSLQIANADQEKLIGNLTNSLVNSLPPEQRKFYLLNPKQFLTMESMVKAILEADGITEEELKAQEARIKLIEEFLQIDDETRLKEKVKEHDAQLDRKFFEILTASIQAAQLEGNQAGVQALFALRTLLARWSSQGQQAVREIDAELGLVVVQNQADLLEKLQNAQTDEEFQSLVAVGHPLLDYGFFQQLTAQIDQATKEGNKEKAQQLKALRTRILETKDRYEQETRIALQQAATLLKKVLQSGDPAKALQENMDQLNEAFFAVLGANIEEARRQKQTQAAQTLEAIGNLAFSMLQERLGTAEAVVEQPTTQTGDR